MGPPKREKKKPIRKGKKVGKIIGVRRLQGHRRKAITDQRAMNFNYERFMNNFNKKLPYHPNKDVPEVLAKAHFKHA